MSHSFASGVGFGRRLGALGVVLCALCVAARGDVRISGAAQNLTRAQAAAGDAVILLRLDEGMKEEARTVTDAQGRFAVSAASAGEVYLVRVVHQGVNYDQRATGGELSISVFDAAGHVPGVKGSIEILRTGTNGNQLHVSDMYEIRNDSQPPVTQAGESTFDVYLPPKAKIDSVLAAGPGKIAVMIAAKPVGDEAGHFAVDFPLQPGATKFAFNYDVPYDGHVVFRTRHRYEFQQVAVMTPPKMQFSSDSAFRLLPAGNKRYEVHAATGVKAGPGPAFEISGVGALPALMKASPQGAETNPSAHSQAKAVPTASPRDRAPAPRGNAADLDSRSFAGAVTRPVSMPVRRSSQSAVLGVIIVLLVATCAYLLWRGRPSG